MFNAFEPDTRCGVQFRCLCPEYRRGVSPVIHPWTSLWILEPTISGEYWQLLDISTRFNQINQLITSFCCDFCSFSLLYFTCGCSWSFTKIGQFTRWTSQAANAKSRSISWSTPRSTTSTWSSKARKTTFWDPSSLTISASTPTSTPSVLIS